MLYEVITVRRRAAPRGLSMPAFSLLVPTWNNLEHLRLFVESLRRHSARAHELVVHVNEGTDGTREWLVAHYRFAKPD